MIRNALMAAAIGCVISFPTIAQNLDAYSGAQAIAIVGGAGAGAGTGTQRVVSVPNVVPPSFYGANPCSNSASAGGSIMGGGVSIGGQWTERECRDQEWFRFLNMAHGQGNMIAVAYICRRYPDIRQAYLDAGQPCPQDRPAAVPTSTVAEVRAPVIITNNSVPRSPSTEAIPDWCMGNPAHATPDTIARCPNMQQRQVANNTGNRAAAATRR